MRNVINSLLLSCDQLLLLLQRLCQRGMTKAGKQAAGILSVRQFTAGPVNGARMCSDCVVKVQVIASSHVLRTELQDWENVV